MHRLLHREGRYGGNGGDGGSGSNASVGSANQVPNCNSPYPSVHEKPGQPARVSARQEDCEMHGAATLTDLSRAAANGNRE